MITSPQKIENLIKEIKKRLKLRSIQHGVSIILLTFISFAIIYFISMSLFGKSSLAFSLILTIAVVVLLLEMIWLIIRPGFSKFSDSQIALFVEEKFPELEDRINSAVEIKEHPISGIEQSKIIDRLIDDATRKIKAVQFKGMIDRKKEKMLAYTAYGLFFVFSLVTFSYMDDLRRLTSDMEFSLNPKTHFGQEIINIIPGNIQIEKGELVDIIAELKTSTDEDLILHYKMGDDVWGKEIMETSIDKQKFIFRLISVQEPTIYYVEHNEIRSPEFNIAIYEFPKVTQIDLRYKYPAYTGLPDRVEENTGNIRGLQGTDVMLTIQTSGSPIEGELLLDESKKIKLFAMENGIFQGKIRLSEPGVYHINLTDDQGKNNKFPIQYQITPVEDTQPMITINEPQRDVRVNAVEEVFIYVSVTDDFGVNSTKIRYAVNGEDEKSISLFEAGRSRKKEINESYLFYLEDYSLEPGDVISYYVDAEDNFHQFPIQSDMYFIEVVPFDAKFTQLNNQGGGGGGRQQGSQMVVNQQTIISATWNLLRKQNELETNEFEESANAIERSQLNLKDNIDERINSTAFSVEMAVDDENKEIADLLRKAVEQMGDAADELSKRNLKNALTPERKALNFLLKADAKNKEKLIQRGQTAGGGGGRNSEDRMTELMDLELDISKDKYEIQQQNEQQKNEEVDETLQKLRELAKKQQLLAQESRENLREQDNRRELDRLKRDQEQLRFDSENLANQMREMARNNDRISQRMQQRIDEITQNLRKAEQDLKSNNIQQAMAKQNQALNELNKLQDELRLSLTDDVHEMLNEFTENFTEFKEKERQLSEEIREEFTKNQMNDGNIKDREELQNLTQKREIMLDKLESLENQARTIEENAHQENPKIATDLKNIQNAIQRENIKRNMEGSKELLAKGWLTYADMIEEEIKLSIDAVDEMVRQLQAGRQVTEEEMLNRSLEDTRDLMRRLQESMAQTRGEQQPNENTQGQNQADNQQQGNRSRRPNSNDAARMGRLMEQANEMLQRMERDFQNNLDLRQQLNNTIRMFGQDNVGTMLGENAESYFKNKVYDPLSQLETQLFKRLDEIELQKKLYSLRKEEVPPEYKRMVDKYFESISK